MDSIPDLVSFHDYIKDKPHSVVRNVASQTVRDRMMLNMFSNTGISVFARNLYTDIDEQIYFKDLGIQDDIMCIVVKRIDDDNQFRIPILSEDGLSTFAAEQQQLGLDVKDARYLDSSVIKDIFFKSEQIVRQIIEQSGHG